MDVADSEFTPHQHIQVYSKNSPITLNKTLIIVRSLDGAPVPPGYLNVFPGNDPENHLCIDVPQSTAKSGTLLQLYPVDKPGGAPTQQWEYIPAGDKQIYIASPLKDKLVLDVRGGSGDPSHRDSDLSSRRRETKSDPERGSACIISELKTLIEAEAWQPSIDVAACLGK